VSLKNSSFLPRFQKSLVDAMKSITSVDMRVLYREYGLIAEPLDGIYLFSSIVSPLEKKGNILFILLLSGLGIVVILIACINVVNLTTARALTRVKEIGIRKALGASRRELMVQYLVESVVLSFISLWFALILVEVGLPLFNSMVKRELAVPSLANPSYFLAIVGVTFFIGIVSGFYPAFYLSSLDANNVLRGQRTPSSRRFREIMVVMQFVLSIGLFIVSAVILREFRLMKSRDPGFDSKDIVMVRLNIPEIEMRYADIKKAIGAVPGVLGVTGSSFAAWEWGQLVNDFPLTTFFRTRIADVMVVDSDYLRVHKIGLVEGQDFDPDSHRAENQLIINETAQRQFGFKINSFLYDAPLTGQVQGVVKDFNYLLPSKQIKPLILTTRSPILINTSYAPRPVHLNYILVKIQPENQQQVIQGIETTWKSINPGYAFDYKLVEKETARQLDDYNRTFESTLDVSTILAFLLSGLGLFGLASFEIERRTKEIGIRKALGATSRQITVHFLLGFLRLIAIANAIAWPLTFLVIRLVFGLIQYPHQLLIGPLVFLEVGALSIVVMVVTVGSQTLRAASSNPVDTLRYE
jgi:putative ABC transport system permease protein